MKVLDIEEAIYFFKTYGIKDDESEMEWVEENNKKAYPTGESQQIDEWDLHELNDWCYVKGTAY